MDFKYNPKYPEFFSLNLDPAYRHFSLGLLIESARASFLLSQQIRYAYVRMAKDTTYQLLMKRLESKFYEELNPKELDLGYLKLCNKCELLGRHCLEQVYLRFDAEAFVEQSNQEIGRLDMSLMPKNFKLQHQEIAGDTRMLRSFRPIWL